MSMFKISGAVVEDRVSSAMQAPPSPLDTLATIILDFGPHLAALDVHSFRLTCQLAHQCSKTGILSRREGGEHRRIKIPKSLGKVLGHNEKMQSFLVVELPEVFDLVHAWVAAPSNFSCDQGFDPDMVLNLARQTVIVREFYRLPIPKTWTEKQRRHACVELLTVSMLAESYKTPGWVSPVLEGHPLQPLARAMLMHLEFKNLTMLEFPPTFYVEEVIAASGGQRSMWGTTRVELMGSMLKHLWPIVHELASQPLPEECPFPDSDISVNGPDGGPESCVVTTSVVAPGEARQEAPMNPLRLKFQRAIVATLIMVARALVRFYAGLRASIALRDKAAQAFKRKAFHEAIKLYDAAQWTSSVCDGLVLSSRALCLQKLGALHASVDAATSALYISEANIKAAHHLGKAQLELGYALDPSWTLQTLVVAQEQEQCDKSSAAALKKLHTKLQKREPPFREWEDADSIEAYEGLDTTSIGGHYDAISLIGGYRRALMDAIEEGGDDEDDESASYATFEKWSPGAISAGKHGDGYALLHLSSHLDELLPCRQKLVFTPADNGTTKICESLVEKLLERAKDILEPTDEDEDEDEDESFSERERLCAGYHYLRDAMFYGLLQWMSVEDSSAAVEVDEAAQNLVDGAQLGARYLRTSHNWLPTSEHPWFTVMVCRYSHSPNRAFRDRLESILHAEHTITTQVGANGQMTTSFAPLNP